MSYVPNSIKIICMEQLESTVILNTNTLRYDISIMHHLCSSVR